jgi:antitoxin HigA-1
MKRKALAIHPGNMLLEEMKERGVSINALARAIRVPPNRVSAIVNGRRAITADTAFRLGRFFGTTPQLWMNLQTTYDLAMVDATKVEGEALVTTKEGHATAWKLRRWEGRLTRQRRGTQQRNKDDDD